jgi:uncharacterized protein YlxW (UPF0749 family)
MKQRVIEVILDKYEKAIESSVYYKERVNRHEDQLRKFNKEIQQLKSEIYFYKAKIDELEKENK